MTAIRADVWDFMQANGLWNAATAIPDETPEHLRLEIERLRQQWKR